MDSDQVAAAIAALEPGAKVRLRLSDGSEIAGELRDKSGGAIRFEDRDAVQIGDVDGVFLDFSGLGGPE